jgi:hypothetical protein
MSHINLQLHIDEVNVILAALGQQRFDQVAGLINKIREQSIPQIEPAKSDDSGTTDLVVE